MISKWGINTDIIHSELKPDEKSRAVSPAIVPAVAYAFPTVESAIEVVSGECEGNYYGRYGNPTTRVLEEKMSKLEGGEDAIAVSSGMAAISISLLNYLKAGDHVVVTKDVYGGTHHFLTVLAPRFGIEVDFVDCTDLNAVENALKFNTKVLYLETPSNPCLTILDLKKLTNLAHSYKVPVIVDNTFMTPILQSPIELGVDVVVHSGTKYINGHGDVIAGFVIGKKKDISFMRKNLMGDLGQNLNAWESYLILRGLKTMGIRLKQHVENAKKVSEFLNGHRGISKVFYPGLPSHRQHSLAKQQMKGYGGIISFELKGGFETGVEFINHLKLAMISFSLGDPETLVQHPASMTHNSIPTEQRVEFGITDGLIRLSVGLEDANDIIDDLDQALTKASTIRLTKYKLNAK
ncbi:trans-sulfuration enzyme family protein [Virgibacillus necropolis]|uniref:homocysteine desulfhydrase n=1 Tax=Virgibacillus necropolis TaxID=163877 RepID=A0A221M9S0_9BACI|nr:aminotransferase class I/II-fold pyridoxal phosphate-dependent enzyme [Virgibacillus necropolis]ASN04387.1 methionine gamma-lyase [Virgibacillus necropolis]